ncbi:MBL fold metallo-hydrolase [Roseovarius pacificus]|uniref:MBL fold metallo-hydrolase n=1 Tax=Roseovarius pacificus TaxID=337701 RepID=UPI002A18701D|nr:MBL fold metallo-hydrolase [Roseovarius pacificus]
MAEPVPEYGRAQVCAEGVQRIVTDNPGIMTYHGTNTYLVEAEGGTIVIDPGPDLPAHVEAIMAATGGRIGAILVTHGHGDHVGAANALRAASDAPIHVSPLPPVGSAVNADVSLENGGRIGDLIAVATPGHTRDHFCFLRPSDGIFFSGDHIMTWSSSIVSPTQGNMADYMQSLRETIARDDQILLPAHGPVMQGPRTYCEALLDLRIRRENAILETLANGPKDLVGLVQRIYPHQTHEKSIWAAGQNLMAHMEKLLSDGRVVTDEDDAWRLVQ